MQEMHLATAKQQRTLRHGGRKALQQQSKKAAQK